MLVNDTISSLINGVSQQPAKQRRPSQCDLQENCVSSVVGGVKKRPPTNHVAEISSTSLGNVFTRTLRRDNDTKYQVIISNGDLKVYDLETGVEQTVAFPDGKTYLSSTSPREGFAMATIADYSFIANKEVTVDKLTSAVAFVKYEALVLIKQARAGVTYKVFNNDVEVATYTTPELTTAATENSGTTTTTNGNSPDTADIAEQLYNQLLTNVIVVTDVNVSGQIVRKGSTIAIRSASPFNIRVEDSYGNTASQGIQGTVQKLSDLPKFATDGFNVEVVGDDSNGYDNHYLTYQSDANSAGEGVWKEGYKQGIDIAFDFRTMPHRLERLSDGTWEFGEIDWDTRTVGDDDSAPFPSFLGLKISDIFTYRARLGILADEYEVFSEVNNQFNFFPTTVTAVLDSDRIDVTATDSGEGVNILKHAVALNKQLTLFSDSLQFSQDGSNILTPKTVELPATTSEEVNTNCRPIAVGNNIYFTYNRTASSGIKEYFVSTDTLQNDAANITSHVPSYLPKNIFKIAGSSTADTLCCLSDEEPNTIYVYEYYWAGSEKLQSAWHKWIFPSTDTILNIDFVEDTAYLLIERNNKVFLETISLGSGKNDTGLDFLVHLDRKVTLTGVYDSNANTTTWTLPYDDLGSFEAIRGGQWTQNKGLSTQITRPTANTVQATGDLSTYPCILGRTYTKKYKFSTFYVKEADSAGNPVSNTTGRLQLRYMNLSYEETGNFSVKVTPKARTTRNFNSNSRILGDADNIIGSPVIRSGTFRFPVLSRNTQVEVQIENDSYLPSAILSADWIGMYTTKSRRL